MQHTELYITESVSVLNRTVVHNDKVLLEAEEHTEDFFQFLYDRLNIDYPKFFKMDALCKLGTAAAHVLLRHFKKEEYLPEEVGIVLSNNSGSIEADINYYESSKTFPSPSLFVYTLPNIVIGEISIRYGFKGENAFFISEKFDAQWIYFYVNNLMQNQNIKCCICGWVDVKDEQYNARLF
ncbi:beta-ketoacyl-[acyl-carrier-protein] synthase family protein [Niabella ginsengisoli]|uniref:3-oxoacyl-ACP synthase n=1 Tax=Niabella ginsengisoli TaxID=522298 RepID=A0ABS9SNC0_9BACT|nr:hypothetical protein [Niabella ginsengisoli]MCH5599881.1 hypothetical protein [Niabella ginsengisoli]